MKKYVLDVKKLKKLMVDLDIKSLNDLAAGSGVSRPTIYDMMNGKGLVSQPFLKICEYLKVEPLSLMEGENDQTGD